MRRNLPPATQVLLLFSRRTPRLASACSRRFSHHPTRPPPTSHPSPAPSPSFYRHGRIGEEEQSRSVVVRVWWDLENCQVPKGVDPHRVAHRIVHALRSNGIRGPVNITAFGDMLQLPHKIHDALCTTGISLHHVPNRGMNSADRSILADLVSCVAQNPPPAHIFLISGDSDFTDILHRLRMNNYNILIAIKDGASAALCSAATIMWHWNGLVRGDELIGRHYNYPPDGLHSSWYGYYKGAIESPFSATDEDSIAQTECGKSVEFKIRPVPLALVSKISNILTSTPTGIGVDDLLRDIKKSNVVLDKDYFGHKKFLNLISSLTHIAKVKPHPMAEGRYVVYSAQEMLPGPDPADLSSAEGVTNDIKGEQIKNGMGGKLAPSQSEISAKSSSCESSVSPSKHIAKEFTATKDHKSSHSVNEVSLTGVGSSLKNTQVTDSAVDKCSAETSQGEFDHNVNAILPNPLEENGFSPKDGVFKRLWRTWMKGGSRVAKNVNAIKALPGHAIIPASTCGSNNYKKSDSTREPEGSKHKGGQSNGDDLNFSVAQASDQADNQAENSKKHQVTEMIRSRFSRRINMWWKFWGTGSSNADKEHADANNNSSSPINSKVLKELPGKDDALKLEPKPHHLFSRPHFWQSMEYFLRTRQGSELVANSTSRTHLVQCLEEEGPSILISLDKCHLLYLVDLLISEKKWIDVCSSRANPFKLVIPVKRTCIPIHDRSQNGLTCIFRTPNINRQPVQRKDNPGQKCKAVGSAVSRIVEIETPKNLKELKIWYCKVLDTSGNDEMRDLEKNFERDFGEKLDSLVYGYSSLESLLEVLQAPSSNSSGPQVTRRTFSQDEILLDSQILVKELLEKYPEGILLSSFKPLFFERYGYQLDHRKLGHSKLLSLLKEMPGVEVDQETILPSLPSNESTVKLGSIGKSDPSMEAGPDRDDVGHSWDELGPPQDSESKEQCKTHTVKKNLQFEEVSVSDEDSPDAEQHCTATGSLVLEDKGNMKARDESLLLQILDSWHSGKELSGKTQVRSADCVPGGSGYFDKKHGELESSVSSRNFKAKSINKYNFVLDNEEQKGSQRTDP